MIGSSPRRSSFFVLFVSGVRTVPSFEDSSILRTIGWRYCRFWCMKALLVSYLMFLLMKSMDSLPFDCLIVLVSSPEQSLSILSSTSSGSFGILAIEYYIWNIIHKRSISLKTLCSFSSFFLRVVDILSMLDNFFLDIAFFFCSFVYELNNNNVLMNLI